jgi:hypothetical protein
MMRFISSLVVSPNSKLDQSLTYCANINNVFMQHDKEILANHTNTPVFPHLLRNISNQGAMELIR